MTEVPSFSIQREVQLRFLSPEDIPEVKRLCTEWFPIEYPDTWYQEIASNPKFYSLAATYHSHIIGLIVSEIKHKSNLNKEDSDILSPAFSSTVQATYLHVLSTNQTAIRFYERRNFTAHSFLPYYYSIQGKPRDGYSYVLYINGGKPPWSLLDYMSQCGAILTKLQPCALPRQIMRTVRRCFCRILSSTRTQDNGNSYVS
ncbi:NAA60-like protein [Mya arenaria]|uniref:histone acetyltransferase n=1 Tax=Mya arenaria TaxID=6604 RepID=A0ABY7DJQ9_MYAAR|nr:NAA60-like protein [Mya arenaria]